MSKCIEMKDLLGLTFTSITRRDNCDGYGEEIIFTSEEGRVFRMYHYSRCCESVYIEDIDGDLQDLVGSPILLSEEVSSLDVHPEGVDLDTIVKNESYTSFTWTFYKFATIKGRVTIRWYGSSNGCYSERADLELID